MCGIFGIKNHPNSSALTMLALGELHGRGHDGHGAGRIISTLQGLRIDNLVLRSTDSITKVQWDTLPQQWRESSYPIQSVIGHVRYGTAQKADGKGNADTVSTRNLQPILVGDPQLRFLIAVNGQVAEHQKIHENFLSQGIHLETENDTELLLMLIYQAVKGGNDIISAIRQVIRTVEGAFSAVLITDSDNALYAFRDRRARRPLCLGIVDGYHVVCSESWPIEWISGKYLGEIKPGEILRITAKPNTDADEKTIVESFQEEKQWISIKRCGLDMVYLNSPASFENKEIPCWQLRVKLGEQLAEEFEQQFPGILSILDFVCAIPKSGLPPAQGFAQKALLPYATIMLSDPNGSGLATASRTFLASSQETREIAIRKKLIYLKQLIQGKNIVVVDDSLIRGTVSRSVAERLRHYGAKRIYLAVTWPQFRYPCDDGGYATYEKELLVAHRCQSNTKEIAQELGWDGICYLSPERIAKALGLPQKEICWHCVTGERFLTP